MVNYWLMKTEPDVYSIDDLKREGIGSWEGVRNFRARNFMRDSMKIGDRVLFYHSNAKPPGVAGIAEVCSKPYPDPTALDPKSPYYSPKSTPEAPIWMMVNVKFIEKFPRIVSLDEIRHIPECQHMLLLQKGQRLSILPVNKQEFQVIVKKGSSTRL